MSGVVSRRRWMATCLSSPLLMGMSRVGLSAESTPLPSITAMAFSPGGDSIVAGSQSGLMLCDPRSGNPNRRIECEIDNLHDMSFAPDGRSLCVVGGVPSESGVAHWYRWPERTLTRKLQLHADSLYAVQIAPDASRWLVASGDETCSVLSIDDDRPMARFTKHSRPVLAGCFLPDSRTVVTASRDQTLRVWDSDSAEPIRTLHNHSRDVHALAVQPGQQTLPVIASASDDRTVRFWQPTIGRMVRFARLPSPPLCIGWVLDGSQLIVGCRDGKARWVDPQTVAIVKTVDVSDGWLYCVAVDPTNDRRVAFGTTGGRVIPVASED